MDLNPAIAAAAVISGAYVGDTSSPLSDSANLAAAAAEVDLYEHIRETAITSGLSLIIALAVFFMLGQPGAFDASEKMAALQSVFQPTLLLFVPLLVVLALAILKFPPFTTIFIGALTGALLAVIVAPERVIAFADAGDGIPRPFLLLKGVWLALASGYKSETGYAMIDQLVTRGGMESMLNTIWLIITALAFGGVVEKAGVVERLITPVIKAAKSAGSLVAATVGAVIATNIVTADQFIAIVLPGRMFKSAFENRGFAPVVLSRTIGASGTPTGALDPLEQLRRLLGRHLGCPHLELFALRGFQLREPAAGDRVRVPRPADDARIGETEASVGDKGTANGDDGVAASVDPAWALARSIGVPFDNFGYLGLTRLPRQSAPTRISSQVRCHKTPRAVERPAVNPSFVYNLRARIGARQRRFRVFGYPVLERTDPGAGDLTADHQSARYGAGVRRDLRRQSRRCAAAGAPDRDQ